MQALEPRVALAVGVSGLDTVAPRIASVAAPAGEYDAGGVIRVTVNFTEKVFVTGTPTLPVAIGGTMRDAVWNGTGSGTRALVFNAAVVAGDLATAGVRIAGQIGLPDGAAVRDRAGNDLLPVVARAFPKVRVDAVGPRAVAFAPAVIRPSGVTVRVSFSEPVVVSGDPFIPFTVGGASRRLVYASGSGTDVLTFRYRSARGEVPTAENVVVTPAAIVPGSARITDRFANAATSLTEPLVGSTDPGAGEDHTDADFSNQDPTQKDFTGAILTRANLSGANIATGRLSGATLTDAKLVGASLIQANLAGAVLTRADLSRAGLLSADFSRADLRGALLTGARDLATATLTGANLSGQDLSGLDFSGRDLAGTNLSYANLTGTIFTGADLTNADLTGATLTGAVLDRATLRGVNFTGVVAGLQARDFTGADIAGATFTGASLIAANFSGADLTGLSAAGADFSRARLVDTILADATLVGAQLQNSVLAGTVFRGANLESAQFGGNWRRRVDLSTVDLANANLTKAGLAATRLPAVIAGVNFTSANLYEADTANVRDATGASFRNADLRRLNDRDAGAVGGGTLAAADFTGADLREARLDGMNLAGAKLVDANLVGTLVRTNLVGADLTRATLSGANLLEADLSRANLTGAELSRANLTRARLANANLTDANLYQTDLTDANLPEATLRDTDLRSVILRGANLAGVDLSDRVIASGVTTDLTGVNLTGAKLYKTSLENVTLTGANLTKVDLTNTFLNRRTRLHRTNLTEAVLTGKDLRGIDLASATLTNATLTSTNLTNAKLAGVKLDRADLTGANLTGASLKGADLTGANLTRADLLRADLRDTTLTQVVWEDTNCPYGGKTCEGCSNVSPPSEPPASWLQEASADKSKWQWYQFNGTSAVPDENLTPMLLGTSGAPLQNVNFKLRGYANDGVQGVIYNDTDQRIVVRSGVAMTADERDFSYYANVILDPGGSVPYQFSGEIYDDDDEGQAQGAIEILRYDNGRATGDRAKLWLADYPILQPATEFTPPGHEDPLPQRENWEEDEEHSEIWGSFRMDVKRERDGYRVQGSETFNRYYRDPNDKNTGDWAIFTIRIKSL